MKRPCRECGVLFWPAQPFHHTCPNCFWRRDRQRARHRNQNTGTDIGARLDARTLRRIIKLCHPDLHPPERQTEAHEVTILLVGALERARGLAA